MIQRIQTLFLTVAFGLLFSMIFYPMITFIDSKVVIYYFEYYPTTILLLVTLILTGITIFSFKNRILQMRITTINIIILLGFQVWIIVKYLSRTSDMHYSFTAIFPIVCLILNLIAIKYIARDQAIVIASSRLRPSRKQRLIDEKKKK
ncbi:MAG: DUF4293 domain-containing protein [Bacteroidales bacterium]